MITATLTLIEEIENPETGEQFMQLLAFDFTADELAAARIIPASAGDLNTAAEVESVIWDNEDAVFLAAKVAGSNRNNWGGDVLDFDPMTTTPYDARLSKVQISA